MVVGKISEGGSGAGAPIGNRTKELSSSGGSYKMQVSCPRCKTMLVFSVDYGVETVRLSCSKCHTDIDALTSNPPKEVHTHSTIEMSFGAGSSGQSTSAGARDHNVTQSSLTQQVCPNEMHVQATTFLKS